MWIYRNLLKTAGAQLQQIAIIFLTVSTAFAARASSVTGPGGTGGGSGRKLVQNLLAHLPQKKSGEGPQWSTYPETRIAAQQLVNNITQQREPMLRALITSGELKRRVQVFFNAKFETYFSDPEALAVFKQLGYSRLKDEADHIQFVEGTCLEKPTLPVNDGQRPAEEERRPMSTARGQPRAEICVDYAMLALEFTPTVEEMLLVFDHFKGPEKPGREAMQAWLDRVVRWVTGLHFTPDQPRLSTDKVLTSYYELFGIPDTQKILPWTVGLVAHELARHLGYQDDQHTLAAATALAYAPYATLRSYDFARRDRWAMLFFMNVDETDRDNGDVFWVRLNDHSANKGCSALTQGRFVLSTKETDKGRYILRGLPAGTWIPVHHAQVLREESKLAFEELGVFYQWDYPGLYTVFEIFKYTHSGTGFTPLRNLSLVEPQCSVNQLGLEILDRDGVHMAELKRTSAEATTQTDLGSFSYFYRFDGDALFRLIIKRIDSKF